MISFWTNETRSPMLSPEFLQSVLDCAPDAMLIVDESGTLLFANQQACRVFGYAPGELHGHSVERLIPERFRIPHIGHRLRFTDDRRTRAMGAGRELFALCKDGSERRVEISLGPVRRGLETLIVAAIRDVTDRC